ncbi:hypothetical protein HDU87_004035 [Geranomyces variabilis]|uniref:F-box domain-containing protein n=1 Tax=Geranomyces variabilis TaxID=109894 RepID=A0AAD5XUH7_9FUNG|nr:hypothetical protein HDU87_004035 [Geranomyces variabilis]
MSTAMNGTVSAPKATDGHDGAPEVVAVACGARTQRLEAGHKVPVAAELTIYHHLAARDIYHTRRKTPFPRLPPELISKILAHLLTTTTAHNPSLYAALFVSRMFHACALPLVWRAPRLSIRVSKDAWRGFVRAIKRNAQLIEEMEDYWLGVGYDDKDGYYTLPTALRLAMACADNMQVLRLHLHSDIPVSLPWQTRLRTLVELEIRMRVTDEIVDALLRKDHSGFGKQDNDGDGPAAPCLKVLTLHCSALSDAAVIRLLGQNTPSLCCLTILQAQHSRMQPSRTAIPRLSPATILPAILSTHQKLTALHIAPLLNTHPAHLAGLPADTLRALSLTLSPDLTLRTIATRILPSLPKLSKLAIAAAPQCPYAPGGGEATLAEEEELMRLPDSAPALTALGLKGCELVHLGEYGMREVYGVKGMPWMVDEFVGAWRKRWPAVKLMVEP